MNSLFFIVLGAFIALHLTILISAEENGCNPGFSAFNGHCYLAVEDAVTEPKAIDKCHNTNSTLASIHSEAEFDFVMGLVEKANGSCYIGLKLIRQSENGTLISCYFSDGTTFDYGECKVQSGMKPWGKFSDHPEEPNNFNGNETCVAVKSDGEFTGYFDAGCDEKHGYVCKQ